MAKKKNKMEVRREAIKKMLKNKPIAEQKTIVAHLSKEKGISTNQVTVSRDLRALGVERRLINGQMVYVLPEMNVQEEIIRLAIIDIVHNEATIVIKTEAGMADFVGDYVDNQSELAVLATLAGENVVFVAPLKVKNIKQTCNSLKRILGK